MDNSMGCPSVASASSLWARAVPAGVPASRFIAELPLNTPIGVCRIDIDSLRLPAQRRVSNGGTADPLASLGMNKRRSISQPAVKVAPSGLDLRACPGLAPILPSGDG